MIAQIEMKISAPTAKIKRSIDLGLFEGDRLNKLVLDDLGFFVVKGLIKSERCKELASLYANLYTSRSLVRSPRHSTEVKVDSNQEFEDVFRDESFTTLWNKLFNGNVGLSFVRLLSKSADSPSAVILHQDISYQYGDNEQYSLFLALSECHNLNGGLSLYPGTHKLGYLGDAGELESSVLPNDLTAVCPELNVGDVLLMNSNTWHFSQAYSQGHERLMLEAHIIDGLSPYAKNALSGSCNSEWKVEMNPVNREEVSFFKNSRSQRIKQLQSELDK